MINPIIFSIFIDEIQEVIRKLPYKKVPWNFLLPYETFCYLGLKAVNMLLCLFNKILEKGQMSNDWIIGNIILLLKPKDWKEDLNLVCPITLLETARKLFMKIITECIQKILNTHKILSEINFVKISGGCTIYSIKIINNIMEKAKKEKKEL